MNKIFIYIILTSLFACKEKVNSNGFEEMKDIISSEKTRKINLDHKLLTMEEWENYLLKELQSNEKKL